jgi:hypothetical protein
VSVAVCDVMSVAVRDVMSVAVCDVMSVTVCDVMAEYFTRFFLNFIYLNFFLNKQRQL